LKKDCYRTFDMIFRLSWISFWFLGVDGFDFEVTEKDSTPNSVIFTSD